MDRTDITLPTELISYQLLEMLRGRLVTSYWHCLSQSRLCLEITCGRVKNDSERTNLIGYRKVHEKSCLYLHEANENIRR